MGAFFLIHRDDPGSGGAADHAEGRLETRLAASFRRQGFGEGREIARGSWRARCYPPLAGGDASETRDADGDEAFCAGTLFYRGRAKSAALALLLADRKAGRIDEDELFGSFAALLAIGDRAVVLTDRTGMLHLYATADRGVLSTSFLALAEALPGRQANATAVYDYVLQGAPMGPATVLDGIELFPDDRIAGYSATLVLEPRPPIRPAGRNYAGRDEAAAHCVDLLRARFRSLPDEWPAVDTALSGGYDSRLLLALAWDAGVKPRVHVYGRDGDADVRCAKAIAAGEGFALAHRDKSKVPVPDGERFAEVVRDNFLAFDGCPTDGIFDNGTDLETRRQRVDGGTLMLNGGGGEIFRNFFYLPDRKLRALDIAWTFYCQFDPKICAGGFDEGAYLEGIAARIKARLGVSADPLDRAEVEAVYPLFRCSYWTGVNNSINNRLGHGWTPFLDPLLIAAALDVPIADKNMGRLEARMIEMLSPRLAAYPSDYGRAFDQAPGAAERLKDLVSRWRPPLLRRLSYRLKRRSATPWTGALDRARLAAVIDTGFPAMGRYFRIDAVRDPEQLRRICTLEYLFQQLARAGAD